jgi:hypothetical protein
LVAETVGGGVPINQTKLLLIPSLNVHQIFQKDSVCGGGWFLQKC